MFLAIPLLCLLNFAYCSICRIKAAIHSLKVTNMLKKSLENSLKSYLSYKNVANEYDAVYSDFIFCSRQRWQYHRSTVFWEWCSRDAFKVGPEQGTISHLCPEGFATTTHTDSRKSSIWRTRDNILKLDFEKKKQAAVSAPTKLSTPLVTFGSCLFFSVWVGYSCPF